MGCGGGDKLVQAADGRHTIGLDIGQNLVGCRTRWPDRVWRDCNLEQISCLPLTDAELRDAVVIAADVIEHLMDPEPLVAALVSSLASTQFVLLSTPDRERVHGAGHLGPPTNPFHVREWTRMELASYLAERGARVGTIGWTRANDHVRSRTTILAVLASSEAALRHAGLLGNRQTRVGPSLYDAPPLSAAERLMHNRDVTRGHAIKWARRLRYEIRNR